jgi:hypothetical protein
MTPIFPDCYDEWGLYKFTYDGDHKMYEMLYEGTEDECRQYAYSMLMGAMGRILIRTTRANFACDHMCLLWIGKLGIGM